jgi:4-carboxymuconolactone decarboxylase
VLTCKSASLAALSAEAAHAGPGSLPRIFCREGSRGLDQRTYDKGLEIRSAVLGQEYVNKALADADDFTKPLQDLVTEYCWGAVWGRDGLALKTRSMLNLAMISVLNRPNELRTHVKAALTNGVTREEIREIFLQVAIYAGVPAAVDSFRIAREAFTELDQG